MAKLTLEQIKSRPDFSYSKGIFFKKYPWRVSFWQPDRLFPYNSIRNEPAYRSCRIRNMDIESLLHNQLGYECWKLRRDSSMFVYLTGSDVISKLIDRWGEDIVQIQGPINERHQELMLSDLTLVTKKKLWYNDFRYKVSFTRHGGSGMETLSEIFEFVDSTFEASKYKMNHTMHQSIKNATINPYINTGTVYLTDYDEVATLHLMYKKYITTTAKCILIDEM